MEIHLRPFEPPDFEFCRGLYFQTMRWAIELALGEWNQLHNKVDFASWFEPSEASIIVVNSVNAGWVQTCHNERAIYLGSLYILPEMQRRGIGTRVIEGIFDVARQVGKGVTLEVVKISPAVALYRRLGFQVIDENALKLFMRADP